MWRMPSRETASASDKLDDSLRYERTIREPPPRSLARRNTRLVGASFSSLTCYSIHSSALSCVAAAAAKTCTKPRISGWTALYSPPPPPSRRRLSSSSPLPSVRPLSSSAAKLETLDHRVWTGEGSLVVRRRVVELEVAAALVVVRLLPSSVSI